jgi:cell division protein FtsB
MSSDQLHSTRWTACEEERIKKAQEELEQVEAELASLPARRDELLLRIHDLRRVVNYPNREATNK